MKIIPYPFFDEKSRGELVGSGSFRRIYIFYRCGVNSTLYIFYSVDLLYMFSTLGIGKNKKRNWKETYGVDHASKNTKQEANKVNISFLNFIST